MSGRSSESHVPPRVRQLLERETAFRQAFPQLYAFLSTHEADFRGLSLLIGNQGGFLLVLKKFDDDGTPIVAFANGETPLDALFASEGCLAAGRFRPDKRQ